MHELLPPGTPRKALPWPISADSWLGYSTRGGSHAIGPQQAPADLRLGLGLWRACSASVPTSPARPSELQDHRVDGELEAQTERNPSNPSNTRLASHAGLRQHLARPRQGVWPQRGTSLRKKVSADLHFPKTECFQVTEQKGAARKRCGFHFQSGKAAEPLRLAWLVSPGPQPGVWGAGGGPPTAHTWSPGCCSCQRRGGAG